MDCIEHQLQMHCTIAQNKIKAHPLVAALTIAQKHQLRYALNLMQYALHAVLSNHYIKYCTLQSKLH